MSGRHNSGTSCTAGIDFYPYIYVRCLQDFYTCKLLHLGPFFPSSILFGYFAPFLPSIFSSHFVFTTSCLVISAASFSLIPPSSILFAYFAPFLPSIFSSHFLLTTFLIPFPSSPLRSVAPFVFLGLPSLFTFEVLVNL